MNDKLEDASGVIEDVEQLLSRAEYRKALGLCEAVQLRESLPSKFWFLKARALEGLGEKRSAIEAYRCEIASLKRVPPDLLGQIGSLLLDLGEYIEGAICLDQSCEIAPSPDRLILLASAFFRSGRPELAREAIRRAIDLAPDNDEAWNNLGAYNLASTPFEAEKAFRRALEINPARSSSYGGLALAYIAQGKTKEAVDAAREGLERNPLEGSCYLAVGKGEEIQGDLESAKDAYSKAFRCDFDKRSALLGILRTLEKQGRLSEALDWHLRGVRAWPGDTEIRNAYTTFAETHKGVLAQRPLITDKSGS